MTTQTGDGHDDDHLAWPDLPAWRSDMAGAGPEAVFHLAELCKPTNLANTRYSFDEVLGWIAPEKISRLRGRPIDPDRQARFAAHRFALVQLPLSAVRLWPRAGGLPADWTDRHSVAELAELIRAGAVVVPDQARRLLAIMDAAQTAEGRHHLRAIPPIALPEFHGSTRPDRTDTPWTLDDGSHRGDHEYNCSVASARCLIEWSP